MHERQDGTQDTPAAKQPCVCKGRTARHHVRCTHTQAAAISQAHVMRAYGLCMPNGAPSRQHSDTPWNSTCQGVRCQCSTQQLYPSRPEGSSSTITWPGGTPCTAARRCGSPTNPAEPYTCAICNFASFLVGHVSHRASWDISGVQPQAQCTGESRHALDNAGLTKGQVVRHMLKVYFNICACHGAGIPHAYSVSLLLPT